MENRKVSVTSLVAGALVFLLLTGLEAMAVAPSIASFTNSKTKNRDTMFTVEQGEEIAFSFQTAGKARRRWLVNKLEQGEDSDKFTFRVPDRKDIWEIRGETIHAEGVACVEWVVTTISKKEAPDIFDCFTDGKWQNRTEVDPWGRALPKWSRNMGKPTATNGYLTSSATGDNKYTKVRTPSNIAHGTWQWKMRYPGGTAYGRHKSKAFIQTYHIDVTDKIGAKGYRLGGLDDGHFWYDVMGLGRRFCMLNHVKGGWGITIFPDTDWHTVTAVRKKDNSFTVYYDGELVPGYGQGNAGRFGRKFQDFPDASWTISKFFSVYFGVYKTQGRNIMPEIDAVTVYRNRVVAPKAFEENILTKTPNKINVIVDNAHGGFASIVNPYRRFFGMLKKKNCMMKTIRFTRVNDAILKNFDIYITTPHLAYNSTSQQVMKRFVARGGRVLMIGGSNYGGAASNCNSWLQEFGMKFKGEKGSDVAANIAKHPLTAGVSKVHGLGYTYIDVRSPAKKLISAGAGADKVALAAYENKASGGKVISVGDEWPLADAGVGKTKTTSGLDDPKCQHKRLAENIADWLVKGVKVRK